MASFGKKILSAFVDIEEENTDEKSSPVASPFRSQAAQQVGEQGNDKFRLYFEKLFEESNMPGPDYFEFSRMVAAMQSIPDEKTRYISAFAGLSVQGLDKKKLVESAGKYIEILNADSENFNSTLNNAVKEKVEMKKKELEDKSQRIQQMTREITELNNTILVLGNEIRENEEKIHNNLSGYAFEAEKFKAKISEDIQKINNLL